MTSAADDLKALQDEHDARTDIDNLYAKKLGQARETTRRAAASQAEHQEDAPQRMEQDGQMDGV